MRVASFFCGAGGLDLGYCFAGHEIVYANDFDEFAVETYNKNIGVYSGHKAVCADITKVLDVSKESIDKIIPDCDIVIGGFPCQGFTIANLNRSMEDERNYLYLQLLKVIAVKQPPFFQLENVKGLESMNDGAVLSMIIEDLTIAGTKDCKLFRGNGVGYDVFYTVVNAYNFGVPQNRERVIITGVRKDVPKGVLNDYMLDADLSFSDDNSFKRLVLKPTHVERSYSVDPVSLSTKINTAYGKWKQGKKVTDIDRGNTFAYSLLTLRDAIGDLPLEFSDDCGFHNHSGSTAKVKITQYVGNRATYWDKYAPTVMGRGSGAGGALIPPHPEQHRRLSVREFARIQTFPDDFVFCGANSACYRQIGNAVPVLMAYHIACMYTEYEQQNPKLLQTL